MRHLMVEFSELQFGCIGWKTGATFPNTAGSCSAWKQGHIDVERGEWHDHTICEKTRENWLRQWRLIGTMKLKTLHVSFNARRLRVSHLGSRFLGGLGIVQGGLGCTFRMDYAAPQSFLSNFLSNLTNPNLGIEWKTELAYVVRGALKDIGFDIEAIAREWEEEHEGESFALGTRTLTYVSSKGTFMASSRFTNEL